MRRLLLLSWMCSCCLPAAAATVYRCTGADGRVSYQDTPCPVAERQHTVALPDAPAVPASTAPPPAPPPERAPAPPAAAPRVPLPVLYTCTRATDGTSYLSSNGQPAAYEVPLGILGAFQQPLSDVYGPTHGDAGISAPEANRGRVTPGLIASNYVWVRDQCRELSADETCQALNDAYDENAQKLEHAFKSDSAPLERRDAQLQAQLKSCN